MEPYALVILCGGKSMRIGTDKALLPFGDSCLLEYIVTRFSPLFNKIYLSVREKGDYSHLKLDVTELPDIHDSAGPLSGIFSSLSMIDEESAFIISVDTPFIEPELGVYLCTQAENYDICAVTRADNRLETLYAVFSKSCITTIGKCLLLRQYSLMNLQQKCNTHYILEGELSDYITTPLDVQLFEVSTREAYYQSLSTLYHYHRGAYGDNFSIQSGTLTQQHSIPAIAFVSHPVLNAKGFIERLIPILEKDGLRVILLEDKISNEELEMTIQSIKNVDIILVDNSRAENIPKIEILRKGCLEEPEGEKLLAIVSDFSYKGSIPSFDYQRPRSMLSFLRKYILDNS